MSTDKESSSEIYTYKSDHVLYALAWSVREDKPLRLAAGSFIQDNDNVVDILQLHHEKDELVKNDLLHIHHEYPATKIMFYPDTNVAAPDLLATSSDCLKLWRIQDEGVACDRFLINERASAPLTSFDWASHDPNRIVTGSIDRTCTLWDLEEGRMDIQMVAHEKEVHDLAWGGRFVFASVSADGTARVLDTRDRDHSTIIYRSHDAEATPLLRIGWNKQDPRYLAALSLNSSAIMILDIRSPGVAIAQLSQHTAPVNALAWSPRAPQLICTAGDDSRALIWDLGKLGDSFAPPIDPMLSYNAGREVTSLQWSALQSDRVAICFNDTAQVLRV